MPRKTTTSSSRRSTGYRKLWKSLTDHAIAPTVRRHLQRTSNASKHRTGGGFGNDEFVRDWMQPMSDVQRRGGGARRRRTRAQQRRRRRTNKRRGGFIRGGSVQYFPSECDVTAGVGGGVAV